MKRFSSRYRFSNWTASSIPPVSAGVYAIWDDNTLIYCGMSGRGYQPSSLPEKKRFGLITRIQSHASGRLSGDQFCVYVANRFVIPSLTQELLADFSNGKINLDILTKDYVHEHFEFQYAIVGSGSEAFALEEECRLGLVFGLKPILNPRK